MRQLPGSVPVDYMYLSWSGRNSGIFMIFRDIYQIPFILLQTSTAKIPYQYAYIL